MSRLGVFAGRASRGRPLVLVAGLATVSLLGITFPAQASATSPAPVAQLAAVPPPGSPMGVVDSSTGYVGGVARVHGWAFDPDATQTATTIHVYIDGIAGSGARGVSLGLANLARPDVGRVYPTAGPNHGFDTTITGLTSGSHVLRFYALNVGGGFNPIIGTMTATVPATGSVLLAGGVLNAGGYLTSIDGRYRLTMQGDGNLVQRVAGSGRVLWNSGTSGLLAPRLVMQTDGNAVIYNKAGQPAWSTRTPGTGNGSRLVLQADANIVNINSVTRVAWQSSTKNDRLAPGEELTGGQRIQSLNGAYTLTMQKDGNLVMYNMAGAAVWSSRTNGPYPAARAISQGDGNFVIYSGPTLKDYGQQAWTPLWSTGTSGRGGGTMAMQNDRNLVLYSGGRATWASRTA